MDMGIAKWTVWNVDNNEIHNYIAKSPSLHPSLECSNFHSFVCSPENYINDKFRGHCYITYFDIGSAESDL